MSAPNENINTPVQPSDGTADNIASRAIGALLADMNHDLRTSMNGIAGMLELLCNTGLTAAQQKYARTAQQSVDTLQDLIERMVDLSLIESKQFRLESAPFDLLQEMQAACVPRQAEAQARGISLQIRYPSPAFLNGDAARMRELTSGLVDLALRFAGTGEVAIDMRTASEQPGTCRLEVAAHAAALSESASQLVGMLDEPADQNVAGLRAHGKAALELFLCTQLARLMGGRFDISQTDGKESTLRFSLVLPTAANPLSSIRGMLVAEDAQGWQQRIATFAAQGIGIDVFDSVIAALASLRQAAAGATPYRVVMLGHRVQGMDATILAAAIKGDPAGKDALLVFLEEQPTDDVSVLAQAGFSALVRKSDEQASVAALLQQLWNTAATGRAPAFLSSCETTSKADQALPFAGRRVLVADDNPVNREIAVRMLEKLGCECAAARDGQEAAAMQKAVNYDLIVMDCEMPVMDGFQATQLIRSEERPGCRTPIVALTACAGQGEREKCIASGMDDFLSKPIRPQILQEVLSRWLATPPATTSGQAAPACEDELEEIRDMFGADFAELASLYQRDTPPRIASLHRAHAAGDCALVGKVSHALGGSSASIGATGLSALCKALEKRAKAGILEEFETRMAAIETEYRRISSKLQSLLT